MLESVIDLDSDLLSCDLRPTLYDLGKFLEIVQFLTCSNSVKNGQMSKLPAESINGKCLVGSVLYKKTKVYFGPVTDCLSGSLMEALYMQKVEEGCTGFTGKCVRIKDQTNGSPVYLYKRFKKFENWYYFQDQKYIIQPQLILITC